MSFAGEMRDFVAAYRGMSDAQSTRAETRERQYKTGELEYPDVSRFRKSGDGALQPGIGGGVGTRSAPSVDPATGGGKGSGGSGKMTRMPDRGGVPFLNYAYDYYRSKGLGHVTAASIAGNLQQESGGDPRVFSGARAGDSGKSFYAGQWNGSRLTNLKAFSRDRGHGDITMQDQLDFVMEEGDPNSPYADRGAVKAFGFMNASNNVAEGTTAFMRNFERAKEGPTSNIAGRIKWAESLGDSGPSSGGGEVVASGITGDGAIPDDTTPPAEAPAGGEETDETIDPAAVIDIPEVDTTSNMEAPSVAMEPDPYGTGLYARGGAIPDGITQQEFDSMVRREAMRGSAGRSTGDNARDAVARRINMRERGISSSAFKPSAASNKFPAAPSAPSTGGRRVPTPTPRPATGGDSPHVRHPPNPSVGKGTSRSPELSAMRNMGAGGAGPAPAPAPEDDTDYGAPGKPPIDLSGLGDWLNSWIPDRAPAPAPKADTPPGWGFRKGGAIPDDQGTKRRIGTSQRDADSGTSGYTTRARRDEKGRRTLTLPPKTKSGVKLKVKPMPGRDAGKSTRKRPQGDTPPTKKTKPSTGAELRPRPGSPTGPHGSDPGNYDRPDSAFPGRPSVESDNDYRRRPGSPTGPRGSQYRDEDSFQAGPKHVRVTAYPTKNPVGAGEPGPGVEQRRMDFPLRSDFPDRPRDPSRNKPNTGPLDEKGGLFDVVRAGAKVGAEIVKDMLHPGGKAQPQDPRIQSSEEYRRPGSPTGPHGSDPERGSGPGPHGGDSGAYDKPPYRRVREVYNQGFTTDPTGLYARGGAIPDDGSPPNPSAGAGSYAPAPAPQGVAGSGGGGRPNEDGDWGTPGDVSFEHAVAKSSDSVKHGFQGLSRLFAGDSGAVPTPEGGAMTSSAAQRFANNEGEATDEEVQAIDGVSGVDTVNADEGIKNLMRIDFVVNYWLEHGDKAKGEAAAASLMIHGAAQVKRAGQIAAVALDEYQKSGDPADLKHASDAVKEANAMIPDGINLKIDIDPDTHAVLATVVGSDGKEQTHEVDPAAVPEMLQSVLTGSAYWKAIWQVAHPQLAQQEMVNDAAMDRQQADNSFKVGWEADKNEREAGEEQGRWERNTKLKLWEHDRDTAEGRDVSERARVKDDAFFEDWNARLAAAGSDEEKKALVNEGMQYRYQNTPTRKEPLTEDLIFGPNSQYADKINEEDVSSLQTIARALSDKNIQLEGDDAMDMAAALVLSPNVQNGPQGDMIVDNFSLVFNPGLLPLLGQLHAKYAAPQ